ncbi:protein lingerer isoform X2 [Cylas formicarius]|uniref:protein lingerer isoform X2 n=1 Tax=Cylas formicarius TaxID=197179 RepID=UPI002958BACB|nr:protein lingerer isoform X2 [Cylas formicarius]
MSSNIRTTSKGGKGLKSDKSHKSDGSKGTSDKFHNKEANSKNEELSIREKVKQLIEMTQRSEEEVCLALHESDNDINGAINMLFEELGTGEWETRDKKKKKRQASASKPDKGGEEGAAVDDWNDGGTQGPVRSGDEKERSRNHSNGATGRYSRKTGSGKERHENERNFEDGSAGRGNDRRWRQGAPTRGGGGRGGRGGGRGGRYPPRGSRGGGAHRNDSNYNKQPIDTWDNSNTWDNTTLPATNHNTADEWDDFPGADEWSTEEYSLVETKVFTPSVQPSVDTFSETTAANLEQNLSNLSNQENNYGQQLNQSLQIGQQNVQIPSQSPVPPLVGTLTAAQTQYFSQLSQQNSENLNKQYSSVASYPSSVQQVYNTSPQVYNSSATQQLYNSTSQQSYSTQPYNANQLNNYSTSNFQSANQPVRTKTQRARVPPPSKIPSSAVEMPGGDMNSSITYLDVQFGAMDLMDNNFDSNTSDLKFGSSANNSASNLVESTSGTSAGGLDLATGSTNQSASGLDPYSKNASQSSISSSLTQNLSNSDNVSQTSEHLSTSYNTTSSVTARSTSQTSGIVSVSSSTPSGLDLTKQQQENHSYSSQSTTYNSYPSNANTYSASPYSSTQTTASSYGMANQGSTYINNQSANSYNTVSASSYPNPYPGSTSYQSNTNAAFPSMTQTNSYQTSSPSYPNTSQSVYGANTGLSKSNFGSTATSQYNNYSSSTTNKLGKENSYDNSTSTGNSSHSAATNNTTSTNSLSLSQSTVPSTKTTATLAKSSNSVVSNIPPGVTPVMSAPYIMGQVPYFQQPMYSYEEVQLLQQRLPHMTTPYYDMGYQTPTTLAAVRGDPTGALGGGVGYSAMSADGRFATAATARGDNNSSPVPSSALTAGVQSQASTLTAQQGHQAQPILTPGTAPPYFFATAFNTIAAAPNYPQFGAMYTLPAVTNAHGSTNSNQYPKPATYGSASGYGPYDTLGQSAQEYAKSGFAVSNAAAAAAVAAQAQKANQGNSSTGGSATNDLSAIYGKSHTALGKVNSYDKQGFHSGTPPPFTGTLHGSQSTGLPSGTGYAPQMYIPAMAPQHHTTALMHQPLHQDSGNSTGNRSQGSNQAKAGSKQSYQASYWNQN